VWHPVGEICADCEREFRELREFKALAAQYIEGLQIVHVAQARAWPGYAGEWSSMDGGQRWHSDLGVAFGELVAALCLPAPEIHNQHREHFDVPKARSNRNWHHALYVSPAGVEAINKLHRAIFDALDKCWHKGLNEGQNLLKQLATGKISSEKFDGIEREGRRRAEAD
jgi:hypothetical protein